MTNNPQAFLSRIWKAFVKYFTISKCERCGVNDQGKWTEPLCWDCDVKESRELARIHEAKKREKRIQEMKEAIILANDEIEARNREVSNGK